MKIWFKRIKSFGKEIILEVVAYTEKECLDGAKMAVECNCDYLMGTKFFDSVNNFCLENILKYLPFVGKITGRPSIIEGTLAEMVEEAKIYLSKSVNGIDLLG